MGLRAPLPSTAQLRVLGSTLGPTPSLASLNPSLCLVSRFPDQELAHLGLVTRFLTVQRMTVLGQVIVRVCFPFGGGGSLPEPTQHWSRIRRQVGWIG